MNIEKAIEILDLVPPNPPEGVNQGLLDAIKLGREALKAVNEIRHYPFPDGIIKLPSETKD